MRSRSTHHRTLDELRLRPKIRDSVRTFVVRQMRTERALR